MDLCQIHMEDVFGSSMDEFECQGHQGQKKQDFLAHLAAYVRYIFGYSLVCLFFLSPQM